MNLASSHSFCFVSNRNGKKWTFHCLSDFTELLISRSTFRTTSLRFHFFPQKYFIVLFSGISYCLFKYHGTKYGTKGKFSWSWMGKTAHHWKMFILLIFELKIETRKISFVWSTLFSPGLNPLFTSTKKKCLLQLFCNIAYRK